jgi:hypothetical protein
VASPAPSPSSSLWLSFDRRVLIVVEGGLPHGSRRGSFVRGKRTLPDACGGDDRSRAVTLLRGASAASASIFGSGKQSQVSPRFFLDLRTVRTGRTATATRRASGTRREAAYRRNSMIINNSSSSNSSSNDNNGAVGRPLGKALFVVGESCAAAALQDRAGAYRSFRSRPCMVVGRMTRPSPRRRRRQRGPGVAHARTGLRDDTHHPRRQRRQQRQRTPRTKEFG